MAGQSALAVCSYRLLKSETLIAPVESGNWCRSRPDLRMMQFFQCLTFPLFPISSPPVPTCQIVPSPLDIYWRSQVLEKKVSVRMLLPCQLWVSISQASCAHRSFPKSHWTNVSKQTRNRNHFADFTDEFPISAVFLVFILERLSLRPLRRVADCMSKELLQKRIVLKQSSSEKNWTLWGSMLQRWSLYSCHFHSSPFIAIAMDLTSFTKKLKSIKYFSTSSSLRGKKAVTLAALFLWVSLEKGVILLETREIFHSAISYYLFSDTSSQISSDKGFPCNSSFPIPHGLLIMKASTVFPPNRSI